MADGDIKNIRISVTADTSKATRSLKDLSSVLSNIASSVKAMEMAAESIDKVAAALDRLQRMDLSKLASQIGTIKGAMKGFADVVDDPRKWNAMAKALNAETKKEHLKIQSAKQATSEQRLALAAENAKTAAAKEARLAAAEQNRVTERMSKAAERGAGGDSWFSAWQKKWGGPQGTPGGDETWLKDWQKKWGLQGMDFSQYTQSASEATQRTGDFGNAILRMQVDLLESVSVFTSKFIPALIKAYTWIGKLAMKVAVAPFKKLASSIRDAVKSLTGFLAAIKRIAVYRAIRFFLKELTKAFQEGIANLYQYSLLINGTFAKSMDMLATSALYAKNSLAAMVAPIIDELAPAVDYLVDEFVELLNTVNELFASLTGAETWTKAIKYPKQYAEAADGANGKAKELRATLLGFDEINRLDDNRKGSRGSAAEELDYSKMFEQKTVSTKAKNWIKTIKDAFKNGDFTSIGETLGKNLKQGLDGIKWDDVKASVERNASSVATLINGFINVPDLGTTIGKTIAQVFNTAVNKMYKFFNTVEWDKVGQFLGDGLNGFKNTFDTDRLGRTIASTINGAVKLIHNFIDTVDWGEFGKFLSDGINGFFDEIHTSELAETISDAIKDAITLVHTFFKSTDFEKIGEKIGELLKGLDWINILDGLAMLLFDAVKAAFQTLKGIFEENPLAGTIAGIAIVNAITKFVTGTKATTMLGNAILKAVSAGGGTAEAAASAASAATATGGGGLLAGLGSIALPVTLAAVAIGAAWTLSQYFWDRESKNRGTTEPYAGAMFDYENDIMKYRMRVFNLEQGRDIDTKLTAAEYQKLLTMPIKGLDSRVGQENVLEEIVTAMDIYGDLVGEYNKKLDTLIDNTAPIKNIKQKVDSLKVTVNINGTTGSGLNQKEQKNFNVVMSAYAQGGTPDTGSIFLAGEKGVEIIASANGATSVSNRDQIAESVAIGNEEGNAILRELLSVARTISAKDNTTVITTGQITSALNRANARSGNTVVAVG